MVSVLDVFGLIQLVPGPTLDNNLLDIVAGQKEECIVEEVQVDDAGCISDHRHVLAHLRIGWRRQTSVTFKYRRIYQMDHVQFETNWRASSLFINPAKNVDEYRDQLADDVTQELDRLAPVKTATRSSSGGLVNRFLTTEAIDSKKERRRLERKWKRTSKESDRQAYRKCCQSTNLLIHKSRAEYYGSRIASFPNDPRKRWTSVKDLLHNLAKDNSRTADEDLVACNSISAFFLQKLQTINDAITIKLSGHVPNPFSYDNFHVDQQLSSFTEVTIDKVRKLLTSMPANSSPVDFVPTSVIKACSELFAEIISKVANLSFGEGSFPKKIQVCYGEAIVK